MSYPDEWRSGYFFKPGEQARLYTLHDSDFDHWLEPEYFQNFTIYFTKLPGKKGGCSNGTNDCFYKC